MGNIDFINPTGHVGEPEGKIVVVYECSLEKAVAFSRHQESFAKKSSLSFMKSNYLYLEQRAPSKISMKDSSP